MSGPVRDVKAKRYHLLQTHGDSLVGSFEASQASILWGELFTEKERVFLRQVLEEGSMSFGAKDTFQMEYRIAWNPLAKQQIQAHGKTLDHKLIILVHGYSGRITNSWGFAKMVKPLWKQGFTVCLLDMPGFGRSSINQKWNVPLSSWRRHDYVILSKFVENMQFRQPVSFITYRESCQTVLRVLRESPHLVSDRHTLIDPIFTMDDICPMEQPYGECREWFAEKPGKQAVEFDGFLGRVKIFLWAIFTGSPDADSGRDALQAVIRHRQHMSMRITISHVTKEFVAEARAGATGAASHSHLLCCCRYIKDRIAAFAAHVEKAPKEIPPWALEVVTATNSTSNSSSMGSKALPSVDSPAGRARDFNALETVQEVAEVLSRCTTAVHESRPGSVASMEAFEPPEQSQREKPDGRRPSGHGGQPFLPSLALQPSKARQLAASSKGLLEPFDMRSTLRTDAASSKGFRDRGALHTTLKQQQHRSAASLGMSRYGANFRNRGPVQQQSHSESRLQDFFTGEVTDKGQLPKISRQKAIQRTQGGVAVCRSELPPPPFKTEAAKCSLTKCATKATERRPEDPQPARHRLICPPKRTKQEVEAAGYKYSPRGAQVKKSVQEVLGELRGRIPNF